MSEEELNELQKNWEEDENRSDLFRQALFLISMEDFEQGDRSDIFKFVKLVVEQEHWEDSPHRSKLFDVCWNLAEQEEWEESKERSDLFDVSWNLAEQEEWEDSRDRSKLFDVCWNLTEEEEWEDSGDRSKLFDVCWNLTEQEAWEEAQERSDLFEIGRNIVSLEAWEQARERSGRFKMAAAQLQDDMLLLPPHWSRGDLKATCANAVPLISIVIEGPTAHEQVDAEALEQLTAGVPPAGLKRQGSKNEMSPNNVACMFDAFPLPLLELGAVRPGVY